MTFTATSVESRPELCQILPTVSSLMDGRAPRAGERPLPREKDVADIRTQVGYISRSLSVMCHLASVLSRDPMSRHSYERDQHHLPLCLCFDEGKHLDEHQLSCDLCCLHQEYDYRANCTV